PADASDTPPRPSPPAAQVGGSVATPAPPADPITQPMAPQPVFPDASLPQLAQPLDTTGARIVAEPDTKPERPPPKVDMKPGAKKGPASAAAAGAKSTSSQSDKTTANPPKKAEPKLPDTAEESSPFTSARGIVEASPADQVAAGPKRNQNASTPT